MTDQPRFDIWLRAFESNSAETGPAAVSRLFNIPEHVAAGLLGALPRVVRREAPVLQAQRIVAALESIGGTAEMVACPLRPVPVVVVVGEAKRESADAHVNADAQESELRSSQTLQLGTQELAAFGLKGIGTADTLVEPVRPREVTVREVEAPSLRPAALPAAPAGAMAWQSLAIAVPVARTAPFIESTRPAAPTAPLSSPPPALAHAAAGFAQRAELDLLTPLRHNALPALDLSPIEHNAQRAHALASDEAPSSTSSFVLTRDLRAWIDSGAPAAPAPAIMAANAVTDDAPLSLAPIASPTSLSLDLEVARPAVRTLTALPAEDAVPPVPETLRRPSAREVEVRRQAPSVAPPAPARDGKRVLESIRAPLLIVGRAQASDWRTAFSGHPAAGFILVLSSTTLVFWLIELGIR